MGLATNPQQASATNFSCILHGSFSASSANTGVQTVQSFAFETSTAWWFLLAPGGTTAREQQANISCVTVSGSGCKLSMLSSTLNTFLILMPGHRRTCRCYGTRQQASAGPDISLLRPELQRQWLHDKNQHLGDKQIRTSSNLRVWWSCDQCPSGHPHDWMATVNNRQNMDTQCPYCTNNSLCQHNSLLTVAPAVAAYWDTAKNGVTPDQVMAHSHARRHWLCPKCDHSWQAWTFRKAATQSGCPKCSSINRSCNRQPSLTQSQHPAMLEFDFERNRRAGLDPNKITAGSNKMVHWICSKCPRGQPHLFVAQPFTRIGNNSGCPCCDSRKACICNSLQSLYPALAAEYDTARNGVGPEQVLPGSRKVAFWKDASGHTWEQSPFQRTSSGRKSVKRASIRSRLEQQACSDVL